MVSVAAMEEYRRLSVNQYTDGDITHASERAASLPFMEEDVDDVCNEDDEGQLPPTPPLPQGPIHCGISPSRLVILPEPSCPGTSAEGPIY